jgi:hypothetical protein
MSVDARSRESIIAPDSSNRQEHKTSIGAVIDARAIKRRWHYAAFGWLPSRAGIWHESNVTLGYLGTLNGWAKRFSFSKIAVVKALCGIDLRQTKEPC